MSSFETTIREIVRVKDEISLKAHLLEMDLKSEWEVLVHKVTKLETEFEHDLLTLAQKIGHSEEEFFVGDEQQIESLLSEFRDLRKKTKL